MVYDVAMKYRYSKTEIADRVDLINNLRLAFGLVFFASLALMNVFRVDLSLQALLICLVGSFVLFYGLLTFLFLRSSKPALSELIFLTAFLGLVDFIIVTVFIYFSGGFASPYYYFYVIALALLAIAAPYFTFTAFIWAAVAIIFYEAMAFLPFSGAIPYFSRSGIATLQPADTPALVSSALIVPIVIVAFSIGVFFVIKFMEAQWDKVQARISETEGLEKRVAAVSSVYWVLTHVANLENMLGRALEKLLEALGLTSGMILLANPKRGMTLKAKKGIPPKVAEVFRDQSVAELSDPHFNFVGIVMDGDFICNWTIKKLVFNQKTTGFLVIFGKEGEAWLGPQLDESLNAVADEMAAAIYYSRFARPLKPAKK